ncbi:efflux RND transporter periplasmic adaptor subunit [Alcanivorax sp. JB21]|uniref:efflux RND transporter periplasmic adaptor subunit n=1 Tax=Alcanivorax limicola TaxID=2874102 RepID=UPI001CBC6291|nr:efflux RND transporter periplasmic adaptor subunit [Alcanivorax limicola]MBZ2188805.1 efflux RND transporter periplasmic adaptor subunit [Alcanivorax limicola]
MNKKMFLVLLACFVVFGLVFGIQAVMRIGMNQFFDSMPMPAASITVAEAEDASWARGISAVGTARAVNGTQLTTESAGIVTEIRFNSGDMVEKGDILLKLDDATDRAELQSLRAAAELARLELDRSKRLNQQGSISKAELDRSQSQADQASGALNAQQARVNQKTIRAPFSGQLGIRQVDLGEYLSPGTPVVSLQQLDPVYIEFSLPEQRLASIQLEMDIEATVDAWPGERFSGQITAMEPGINPGTRNFTIQATLDNPDNKLRAGMFARVNIDLGDAEALLAIPQTAVSYNPYGNAVFVVIEGEADENGEPSLTVSRRFVRTGRTLGDMVAITEGLEAGDRVATSGLLKLSNNASVIISDEAAPQADTAPTPDNT